MFQKLQNLLVRLTAYGYNMQMGKVEKDISLDQEPQSLQSVFIDYKALTYPVLLGLIRGSWEGLKLLQAPWTQSLYTPFVISIILGILITYSTLEQRDPTPKILDWIAGFFVGLLNSCIIFSAVVGSTNLMKGE